MNPGLRAAAALLDYPGQDLLDHLDEVRAALSAFGPARAAVEPLLARLAGGDLTALQEDYVDTFDRGRRTSLNLFEHVHGDSRDRGQAMVDLLAMYEKAGMRFASDQLPDYLPAFLEFLALQPQQQAREHLHEIAHILMAIEGALRRRASAYAGVFDLLLQWSGAAEAGVGSVDSGHRPAADGHRNGGEPGDDDTSFAAIDAAWAEAPVNFLDAPAPCGAAARTTQPIHIHRRAA